MARLIIKEKDYGNHLFLVQLRNLDSQELMPGCEIYELGPKAFQGMLGTDNGALRFPNVRIPRNQMLARNVQVLRDGTYVPPKNLKHSYRSMVTVRALMAEITGWDLLKAVAVAYHYTTFRKQFSRSGNDQEAPAFNYASVRYRLLPLLAKATALVVVGQAIKRAYDEYTAKYLRTDKISQLEDLHLQTVGAKDYSTEITGYGVETCRIACGGHGYSALSGFGRIGTESSLPSFSYLSVLRDATSPQPLCIRSPSDLLMRDAQSFILEQQVAILVQQHMEDTKAGRDTSYACHALTMAHGDFIYWKGFWEAVDNIPSGELYKESMVVLAQLFSLSIMTSAHIVQCPLLTLTAAHRASLRLAYDAVIVEVAEKHAQNVINAYGFTEFELDSALARSDQSPYEALLDGAQKSEMNHMQHLWLMMVDTRKMWKQAQRDIQKDGVKSKL
ncbi:uncharacterized protein Z519_04347 [Cladophialophora bantiana CBS 173.52]|uniref:Acyl-CoA oxidase C-terminal domain-containing protein n=1 Tax=Cladophialophora bantiana (strain ATCC 10958 / CBS 173.52 / CDC B-1940 / NIH 8579) TaxID=1442370 RepID=A0A0D2EWX0_CLAB1|nr:uncharacterized protein Z519_04347 [Cladophialophora bantiana CBS 173.52]KIW94371.1 hypothetical protein Z519_04347 [Cladophialophora bantiana CBS 173.52]